LTQEGNIIVGEGGDINDEENVVYENALPPNLRRKAIMTRKVLTKMPPIPTKPSNAL
jgi:hypothetical protein